MRRNSIRHRRMIPPGELHLELLETRDVPATYTQGDILAIGVGSTDPDSLSILNLKTMDAGDVINFTDNGFTSGTTGRTGEGFFSYTVPTGGHAVGTVLTWTRGMSIAGTGWISSNPTQFSFSSTGDQLFIFTGNTANWATQAGITLLSGVNFGTALSSTSSSNTTVQPSALDTAFVNLPTSSYNNSYYSGTGAAASSVFVGGLPAAIVGDLTTQARWHNFGSFVISYPVATTLIVTSSPVNQTVSAGTNAVFSAGASGNAAPSVQWEESTNGGTSYTPLANNGVYSGVATNTLTITGAGAGLNGNKYRAVYTNTGGSVTTNAATLTVSAPVSITVNPATLPNPVLQAAYSQTISGNGGTAPYTFTVSAGALPTGLSLNAITGVLAGTPTASGSFTFTVQATDSASSAGTRPYTLVVPLAVSPSSLPNGTRGVAYSQTVSASGGTTPYTFAVTAGALPAGLSLDTNTGVVSGTPTTANTFNFTVTATDSAGNTGSWAYSVTIDLSATVTSIVRVGGPLTNAGQVSWTVTFSEAVSGLTAVNFTLTDLTSSITGEGINSVNPIGATPATSWTVVASTGTAGDGTLRLNATASTGVSPTLISLPTAVTTADFVIDKTAPAVVIGSPSAPLTAGGPVTFTVTYTGADTITLATGDVTLNRTDSANANVAVAPGGIAGTYTVTLSGITGNGTLGISLAANTASDLAGNVAPAAGPSATFQVDNTAPTVSSVVRVGGSAVTNAASVQYLVTFSEPVFGTPESAFSLTTSVTLSGVSIANVSGGPTAFTVTVNTGSGDGTIRLDVPAGSTVADAAGNAVAAPFTTGEVFTIDRTAPAVTIGAPSAPLTAGGPVTFLVTYTDTNLSPFTLIPAQITLNRTGSANAVVGVSGTGNTRTVTLSSITGDGTLGISIPAGTAADAAGNLATAAGPSATAGVDNTAPLVTGVVRAVGSPNPTNATTAAFTVTFNEDISPPLAGAFTLTTTGSLTGATVGTITAVDVRTYTVAVNTGGGDGTLRLNVVAGAAVVDLAGNPLAVTFTTGEAYTALKSAPAVASISPANGSVVGPLGYSAFITGTAADALGGTVASVTVTVQRSSDGSFWTGSAWAGSGSLTATVTGGNWSVPFPASAQDTVLTYTVTSAATDAAGNAGTAAAVAYQWDAAPATATVALPGTVSGPATWPDAISGTAADTGPAGVTAVSVVVTRTPDGFSYDAATQTWVAGIVTNPVTPIAGNWSLPLDAAQLDHGRTYTVSAAATDTVGNTQPTPTTAAFTFDAVAPVSDVTDPAAAYVGSITWLASNQLAGTVSDTGAAGTAGVVVGISRSSDGFFWNGSTWQSATTTVAATVAAGAWTSALPATALTDGLTYTVTSTATDGVDNIQSLPGSRSFTWDAASPSQTITTPSHGSFAGPALTGFAGTADDPGAVASGATAVDLTLTRLSDGFGWNGTAFVSGVPVLSAAIVGGNWTYSFDPSNLADGETYELTATARDAAQNFGLTATASFTFDAAGPTTTFTAPDAGSTAGASTWTGLAGTAADAGAGVQRVEYRVLTAGGLVWDGSAFGAGGWFTATGTTSWSASFAFANFPAGGGYRVEARGVDTVGNVGPVAAADFTVTVPAVTAIVRQSPTAAVTNTTAPVTWRVTFSDPVSGVTAANFTLTGSFATSSAVTDVVANGAAPATEWDVTATVPAAGTGTLGLNYVSAVNLIPTVCAVPVPGAVYTLDRVAPTATITNDAPGAVVRVNQPIRYSVTFSDDIALTPAGLTAGGVANAAGPGAAPFDVTNFLAVGTTGFTFDVILTGEGAFQLRLTAPAVTDTAGNTLAVPVTDATVFTADGTAPTVLSVVPVGTSPTRAATVSYTVTFSEPVSGVGIADFEVFTTGAIVTGTITVNPESATIYTVTVGTGTGDGTVRLDVLVDGSIVDAAGNPLAVGFTAAPVYTIDRTAPTATATLDPAQASLTPTEPIRFLVTFSEPVSGFGAAGVILGGTAGGLGTATKDITNPSGDNRTFAVEVSGLTAGGTVAVTVPAGAASDAAGNTASVAVTSLPVTLDLTDPGVASIVRGVLSPTNAASVTYTVTFSEAVTGVDATDFALDTSGLADVAIANVTGGGDSWTVTVDSGTGDGTLRLDLRSDATIADAAGNTLPTGGFIGEVFEIDRTGPFATVAAPTPAVRNTPVVSVEITFDEAVTGLDVAAFTLTRDGTPLDLSAANLTGDGTSYSLGDLSGLTGLGGVYVLTLDAGLASVVDAAGNPLAAGGSTTFTVDIAAPTVTLTPTVAGPTNAAQIGFTVAFSEPVNGVDTDPAGGFDFFTVTGTAPGASVFSVTAGVPGLYTVVVSTGTGAGTVGVTLTANAVISDAAGNPLVGLPVASAFTAVDHVRPTVGITDADADGIVAANVPVVYTVDVLDAGGVSGTLTATDFTNLGTAGATVGVVTSAVIAGGRRFSVPVTPTTGGSLLLQLNAGAAVADGAGNDPDLPVVAGRTLIVDAPAPTVTVTRAPGQAADTNTQPIQFVVEFSEPVVGFGPAVVRLTGPGTAAAGIAVSGDGQTFVVEVSGLTADGAVTLSVPAGVVTDVAGNPNAGSAGDDNTVTLDTAPPAVGVPVLDPASDTGAGDGVTADATPTFTGTAEIGALVELFVSGILRGSATATTGPWTITSSALVDGPQVVFARATDAAGNTADSGPVTVTIDTVSPAVAVTRAPGQAATILGTSGGVSVTFAVTTSQAVGALDPAAIAVVGTAGGTVTSVTGSGSAFLVTVAGITRPGNVSVAVAAGAGVDVAGNSTLASPAGESVAVQFETSTRVTKSPELARAGETLTLGVLVTHGATIGVTGSVALALTGPAGTLTRTLPVTTDQTDGRAVVEFTDLPAGEYTATASFLGTGGFLDRTNSITFTVIPALPTGQNSTGVYAAVTGTTVTLFNPDGSVRGTAAPFSREESPFGVRVAVADVTGDGVPDLLAGTAPGVPAAVRVLDGATGAAVYSLPVFEGFRGGVFVAAGDLNGDGKSEFVVTPDQGGGARVLVFDGATGQQLASFLGIQDPNFRGGARVAVGDLNADGVADLLVSAGFSGGPRVAGFDGTSVGVGRDPAKLFNDFFLFAPDLRDGVYVTVGDIDGDGSGDLIGGAGPGGAPRVLALSGHDLVTNGALTPLTNFFAGASNLRGGVRVAAKDFDGDGRADLITGSGDTGDVLVYANAALTGGTPLPTDDADIIPGFLVGVHVG